MLLFLFFLTVGGKTNIFKDMQSKNAPVGISSKLNSIFVKEEHFLKQNAPILLIDEGNFISFNFLHPLKEPDSINDKELGNITSCKFSQSEKTLHPKSITEFGINILVNDEHCWKA